MSGQVRGGLQANLQIQAPALVESYFQVPVPDATASAGPQDHRAQRSVVCYPAARIAWREGAEANAQLKTLQKRIPLLLAANGGIGPVARNHDCVIRQIEETSFDGRKELTRIAAGQIGTTDRIAEKRVAC